MYGQQHVGSTHKTGLGELFLCLNEAANHQILVFKGETATCAEVTELHSITDEADTFSVGLLIFFLGIVMLKLAFQFVHHLGDGGQDGHLPKHGAPQQARNGDVQMAFLVLAYLNLGWPHVEAFQEGEEPQREVVAFPFHETHFLVRDFDVAVKVELFAQFLGEAFGINRVVSVHEGILSHSAGKLLEVSVAHAEGV